MASAKAATDAALVRKRTRQFLTDKRPRSRQDLIEKLSRLRTASFSAWSLGGFPRDLVSTRKLPRDIDIVVDDVDPEEVVRLIDCKVLRKTRFGGIHAQIGTWPIDVWSISQTWAFREGVVRFESFDDLPKTTFLNIEAIAVELFPRPGKRARRVIEYGFFEAMQRRLIEVNLEENPFPGLCVVRALVFAERLRFDLGSKLVTYLAHHMSQIDIEELLEIQKRHYGQIFLDANSLNCWGHLVQQHLRWRPLLPMKMSMSQANLF